MEQEGLVIGENENYVKVLVYRDSACSGSSCESCGGCGEKSPQTVDLNNQVSAKIGDRVEIYAEEGSVLKNALIAYMIPFLGFVGGIILASLSYTTRGLAINEGVSFLFGFLGLFIAYLILKMVDRRYIDPEKQMKIVRVIDKN